MLRVRCKIGYMGDTPELNRNPLTLADEDIPHYFRVASSSKLELRIDKSSKDKLRHNTRAKPSALRLHNALRTLIGDPKSGKEIGLLFARVYQPKVGQLRDDILGVMFDRGFATPDDPRGEQFKPPRQGCAVFLDSIRKIREKRGEDAVIDEAVYTSIHELGHVFNLTHKPERPKRNFMAGSVPEKLRINRFFKFTDEDNNDLSDPDRPLIRPGGCDFRGKKESASFSKTMEKKSKPEFSIEISTARTEFLSIEPFELDVRVSVPKSAKRKVKIPNEIDPGYRTFLIWIEHPSGERLLYKSPRYYCAMGNTMTLNPGESFERDISIFGQSGGYTFRLPGEYNITAELILPDNTKIMSNKLTIEILPSHKDWGKKVILSKPGVARLLYHRQADSRSSALRILKDYRNANKSDPNISVIDYTIGRIHADIARELKTKDAIKRHQDIGNEYLKYAADNKYLGSNARRISVDLLDELKS